MRRPLILACLTLLVALATLPATARAESGATGTARHIQSLRASAGHAARATQGVQAGARIQTPPSVKDNTRVSPGGGDSNDYSETAIAVDPTDHSNLLAGSNIITAAPMASFASHDKGVTWPFQNRTPAPSGLDFSSDPGPLFDANGVALYTYIDVNQDAQHNILGLRLLITRSPDKGATWQAPVRIDNAGDNPDKPLPAVDLTTGQPNSHHNRLYVAYDNNFNLGCTLNCPQPAVVSYSDNGTSWTQSTIFNGFGNIGGFPAVGPDGSVYYLWDDYGSTPGGQIVIAKSTDGGATWTALGTNHKVIANTTVGFGVQLPNYASNQAGARPVGPAQAMAIDGAGNIYVVWGDEQPTKGSRMHIYFSKSPDGGATWTSPARVDTGNVNDAWQPAIAVDTTGKVKIAWYDRRDDGANTFYGVYYTQSTDATATAWLGTQVPVAQTQSDPRIESLNGTGDYMEMVATEGLAHPVWADTRDGRMEIFTATIDEALSMTTGGPYNALKRPFRLLDTRGNGQLSANASLDITVAGRVDPGDATNFVPATGVGAAVVNVTTTNGTAASYLTVYPQGGGGRPLASNVNFLPYQTIANLVQVALGSTGRISVYNSQGSTDVIVDVIGYYNALPQTDKHGLFKPIAPVRIGDSRNGTGIAAALAANGSADLQVSGSNGVFSPGSGTTAVVLNVTAVNSAAPGYLAVFPQGSGSAGQVSNVNFPAGRNLPNRVVVTLGTTGKVTIYNGGGAAVDVVVDLNGSFTDASNPAATGAVFHPFTPVRILDTRGGSQLGPNGVLPVAMLGNGFLPSSGVAAVTMNTTVTNASAGSFLTVFPDDVATPNISDLNFGPADTIPNLVIVKVGASGGVKIYNNLGATDVLGDLSGYYS